MRSENETLQVLNIAIVIAYKIGLRYENSMIAEHDG